MYLWPDELRMTQSIPASRSLRTVGLFAGIGGVERGLQRHGHTTVLLSEIDPAAQVVLRSHFPNSRIVGDIRGLYRLPPCDLVAAGFPCQDLSQCGKTQGIQGANSSLVQEVFRLVEAAKTRPEWLVLENVPFMLRLDRGRAMTLIASELVRLGYRWAYRTVDVRAFGIPQRRLRVVLVASRSYDPGTVLFADEALEAPVSSIANGYGFYWTEGTTGLGWAVDSVPTIKGGSGLGIPSPPAVWIPAERRIVTVGIRDAERLQGFPAGWTKPADLYDTRAGTRWRLVGNAVCVPVAGWVGRRLATPGKVRCPREPLAMPGSPWPRAASGDDQGIWAVDASTWPVAWQKQRLLEFLRFPTQPLSVRATAGFLKRAKSSRLTFAAGFLDDLDHHLATMTCA